MTKELKTIARQQIEQSFKLPTGGGFTALRESFGQVAAAGVKAGQEIAVQNAITRGGLAAQSDETPRKLAPGVGAATKAFNQAYQQTTAQLITLNVADQLQRQALDATRPGNLGPNSLARFNEIGKSTIEGALAGAPDEIKAMVGVGLHEAFLKQAQGVARAVEVKNLQDLDENFQSLTTSALKQVKEGILSGDSQARTDGLSSLDSIIKNQKALGLLSENGEQALVEKIRSAVVESEVAKNYLQARSNGAGEQFQSLLAQGPVKGMTNLEWMESISQVNSLASKLNTAESAVSSLSFTQAHNGINNGTISQLSDLDGYRDKVSAIDYERLVGQLETTQAKMGEMDRKVKDLEFDNAFNPSKAANAKKDVKDEAYRRRLLGAWENKKKETDNPEATLSLVEKAEVAQSFNFPVPAFNDELSYLAKMPNLSPEQAQELLNAFSLMLGTPGIIDESRALKLEEEADKILFSALMQTERASTNPQEAIALAQNDILSRNDDTLAGRKFAFNQKYVSGKTGTDNIAKLFKSTFDADASENPEIFKAFSEQLRMNVLQMGMDKGPDYTARQMANTYGKSKFGPQDGQLIKHPIEKTVENWDQGVWLDNQKNLALWDLAQKHKQASKLLGQRPQLVNSLNEKNQQLENLLKTSNPSQDEIKALQGEMQSLVKDIQAADRAMGQTVQWGGMNKPPDSDLTQEDLYIGKKIWPTFDDTMLINAVPRKVFVLGDSTTLNRESGNPTYGWYYTDDNGINQPVMDPFSEIGVAEWAVQPMSTFIPDVAQELSNKSIEQSAYNTAAAEFEAQLTPGEKRLRRQSKIARRSISRRKKAFIENELEQMTNDLKKRQGIPVDEEVDDGQN